MDQAGVLTPASSRWNETKVIALVGAAHFVSHYYILLLPPLFAFIRADYGVSYTEIGLALTVFNTVTAALQTPAGFLVDRVGAHKVLVGGVMLGASAVALTSLVPSFWFLVAMFAFAGVANAVYHPADYAILSRHVSAARMGQAFSIHTFAGMLGFALAPSSLLILQAAFGWRGSLMGAAVLGFAVAGLLIVHAGVLSDAGPARWPSKLADGHEPASNWRFLLSAPILRNLALFILIAIIGAGLQNFSVVALQALYGTPLVIGNVALTGYLLLSAVGVLLGGIVATRTARHDVVALCGLVVTALGVAAIGVVDLGSPLLVLMMSLTGLIFGLMMPSRDMIVRSVTPADSFGKVFGFVSTGFNLGGIVSPIVFGYLMDHGSAQAIFTLAAACCLLATLTVIGQGASRHAG